MNESDPSVEKNQCATMKDMLRVLRRFGPMCKRHWAKLVLILLITPLVSTVLSAMLPVLSIMLIDEALPRGSYIWIVGIVTSLALTGLSRESNYLLDSFIRYNLKMEIFRELGDRFYQHMLEMSMGFHTSRPVGERIFRAFTDVHDTSRMIGVSLPTAISMIIQGLVMTAVTVMIDWRPIIVIIVFLPPYFILAQYVTTTWRVADRDMREHRQDVTAHLQQSFSNILVVKSATQERAERRRYARRFFPYLRAYYRWIMCSALQEGLIIPAGLAASFSTLTGFVWGYFHITGQLTLGQWFALQALIPSVVIPLSFVVFNYQTLRREMVAAERVLQVLDIRSCVPKAKNPKKMKFLQGRIEFRNVTFGYPGAPPILKNVSFIIESGMKTAIVGYSGCGKSTIINLILRFYDPDDGEILIDGYDLRELDIDDLRKQMGVVLQKPQVFAGSVRENLLYGCRCVNDEMLNNALEMADCTKFISELNDGLDSVMGEGGNLSGGQRQRLTIARALVRNPRILILDEPLASVDVDSESRIYGNLCHYTEGKTALFVTHNPPSVEFVDKILVLDEGEIIECGQLQDLINSDGFFRKMYDDAFIQIQSDQA